MSLLIGAVLQARLGSTRLKEKALLPLFDKPLIQQVFLQAAASKKINQVVLMTSDSPLDQKLIDFYMQFGAGYSTGPVDDIIGRLFRVVQKFNFDYVVRIWGDCPFICPDVIDEMLDLMIKKQLDFISNSDINKRTFPTGLDVEIYSKSLIEKMNSEVTDLKKREFPIEYIRSFIAHNKQDRFHDTIQPLENHNEIHLTIDYKEDLIAAERIYEVLRKKNKTFNYIDLKNMILESADYFNKFSTQDRNIEYKKFLDDTKKGII